MSNILFYSDKNCQTQISGASVTGASDGTCTQFGISSFGSFAVRSLGAGCVVTVYNNDIAYCSSNKREVVALNACVANSTINQFSVDGCRDASAAAPVVSSQSSAAMVSSPSPSLSGSGSAARTSISAVTTTATGANGSVLVLTVSVTATATVPANSASPTDSTASEGLSTGTKAGIGVGIALLVVALITLAVFFVFRYKKKQKTPPVSSEEKQIGLGVAPAYSFRDEKGGSGSGGVPGRQELPPEGRPLAELLQDSNAPGFVEAPGDHAWRTHELGTGHGRSELVGSTPSLHEKHA